ncbi:family 1 carbohydrate esterase [Heterobasidion irregulare TC 32-1]|uniref:Carboxylic ester hydrolase n=1 Tax=Heterobasidion irregulare (strain TC 32-1) TaxID=747525 RepID=W4JPG0_HETIT|nr:family 1 carbohydrate esterase [Heterobasidion irregulare TC 32-1]ETW75418.1 family 1 carbohydrate esterase [Heterobasidion irregulare TC 32-1]
MLLTALLTLGTTHLSSTGLVAGAAGALQQVMSFGANPTNVGMFVYKPAQLASPTPLIVAMHFCTGTAQIFFSGTQFANLADTHGFIVVYPNAPDSGGCWDVHTNATLTHDAGGDSLGIASMVRYAIASYGVDPQLVFMTGSSSGAMMTNVLAGAYPDLFQAGVAFSGVPYSCFSGPTLWNSACADGDIIMTPQQWGTLALSGYPGYTGARPRMQLWHGTADTTLFYPNFGEEIKQWTDIFGVSQTPTSMLNNSPAAPWTRTSYGANVMGLSGAGVGHPAPVNEAETLAWFGIAAITPGSGGGGSGSTTSAPTATTTAAGATQTHYGQCGGVGWSGPTACASGFTCKAANDYYSQCL